VLNFKTFPVFQPCPQKLFRLAKRFTINHLTRIFLTLQYQQLLPQTQFTNHQQVLESHYSPRNIPAQDRSGLSSFQNQQGSPHGTNFILPPPSPALSYRPTYHPDIIRIENRPPSQLGVHIPQRHNSISTCPETPSPPPSPSPPATMAMPQPMPPLPSYTR
jgi:hypothetical protein